MRFSTLFATLGLALAMTLALPAQTVRVIFVSGQASLQRPDEADLRPAVKGETVIIGTRIVTGADGRVVLTPMPGVKSIVAPNSTLLLESVSETRTSPTQVTHQAVLDLKEGAVVSDLQKPEGVTYDYSIRTARGLAGARGTTFTVGINKAGIQTIIVSHGVISLSFTDGRQVRLTPGQVNITEAGGKTQSATKIEELSPEDAKKAQTWAETTVDALATALEAGITIDPDALKNALTAINSLGIVLPPELQTRIDNLANRITPPDTNNGTDTTTTKDVITQQATPTDTVTLADFKAKLTTTQLSAFEQILTVGGFQSYPVQTFLFLEVTPSESPSPTPTPALTVLEAKLSDPKFAQGLLNFINFYAELLDSNYYETYVLSDLGILGDGNLTAFGTDTIGLKALVDAYYLYDISPPTRLDEADFAANRTTSAPDTSGDNYFFPGTNGNSGQVIYNVTFGNSDTSYLYVGATRELRITNSPNYDGYAFRANYGVELRAGELVDLMDTKFSPNISSILIAASTINLTNINFPAGSYVELQAKTASVNFRSATNNAPVPGKVNFRDVSYGSTLLTPANFGDGVRGTEADGSGGNVQVNVLGYQAAR